MQLKVYVWERNGGNVGHAALRFDNEYISFWPHPESGGAGKKHLKIKSSQRGHLTTNLQNDILSEGGQQPHTVIVEDIDGEALENFIAKLRDEVPAYQLAKHNCSHVVASCLKVATGKNPSFKPEPKEYGRLLGLVGSKIGGGIWTPSQVLRYARELTS